MISSQRIWLLKCLNGMNYQNALSKACLKETRDCSATHAAPPLHKFPRFRERKANKAVKMEWTQTICAKMTGLLTADVSPVSRRFRSQNLVQPSSNCSDAINLHALGGLAVKEVHVAQAASAQLRPSLGWGTLHLSRSTEGPGWCRRVRRRCTSRRQLCSTPQCGQSGPPAARWRWLLTTPPDLWLETEFWSQVWRFPMVDSRSAGRNVRSNYFQDREKSRDKL